MQLDDAVVQSLDEWVQLNFTVGGSIILYYVWARDSLLNLGARYVMRKLPIGICISHAVMRASQPALGSLSAQRAVCVCVYII